MSLTNEMLRNLEKNKPVLKTEIACDDLEAVSIQSAAMKNTLFFLLFTLMLIIVYDIFHYQLRHKNDNASIILHPIKIAIPQKTASALLQKQSLTPPSPESVSTATLKTTMVKTPSAETVADKADQDYQNALALIAQNHFDEAITKLQSILATLPEDEEARATLATLLLEQNDPVQATRLLENGLSYEPNNPELTTLYARALIKQEKYAEAEKALQSVSSTLGSDATYLELTATIDQHLGKADDAVAIYEKLITQDPTNGRYFIDLGLSLEKANKPNEAVFVYKKALSKTQLPIDLQSFVTSRISALGGN